MKKHLSITSGKARIAALLFSVSLFGFAGCANTEAGKSVKDTNAKVEDASSTTNRSLNNVESAQRTGDRFNKLVK